MIHASSPLLVGPPIDFAAATRRYVKSRSKTYSAADVDYIVALYQDVCRAGEVDLPFTLTQMVHETGGLTSEWSQPPKRNPAGIGVTGGTGADGQPLGLWFDTWSDAVEAHVGLILCYRFPAGQGSPAQQRLINEVLSHGRTPPRGIATNVGELASKWAADTLYVDKLAAMYTAISKA